MEPIYLILIEAVIMLLFMAGIMSRYHRCPPDKILVIYGAGGDKKAVKGGVKFVHNGGTFVWPVIQSYTYLPLTPINIDVNLTDVFHKQKIRANISCRFAVGISIEQEYLQAASERLLGLTAQQIQEHAYDILLTQLRIVVENMNIEELNSDRNKMLEAISSNAEPKLKEFGLHLFNTNVTSFTYKPLNS